MSTIDHYGEFEMPEEKVSIEVVEDPVKVVVSCYEMFKMIIKGKTQENGYYSTHNVMLINNETLKIFNGKEKLKPDAKQIEEIVEELRKKAKEVDGTGIFLSTLVNQTKINTLYINEFPKLDQLGYLLKKNKTIILGPKNYTYYLGTFAQGNTINKGTTRYQGIEADGGNHINLGKTRQGNYADGGNYINKGMARQQGDATGGGNYINQETATTQGIYTSKGNHINLKTVECKGKSVIDLSKKRSKLKTKLEQKLSELDFLKTEDPSKLIQLVNAYDWQKFDKELNEICGKIKEMYGKSNA